MTTFYVALDDGVALVKPHNGSWLVDISLTGSQPQAIAVDPLYPEQVYCATFTQGLWRSSDAGRTWSHVEKGISQTGMMSVAVSSVERAGDYGVVYAGSEPTAFFRSEDGGQTWQESSTLNQLPSASTWSFPPRPYTSHVRWITPDPLVSGRIFVAVEAGALLRSLDGGMTWEDRKPTGPFDTHTLVMHPLAPERLYSAAGDGFMRPGNGFVQSDDGGDTWYRPDEGLGQHYLWSVAADPADPDTLIISAAPGPQQAHNPMSANSTIYRRSAGRPWQRITSGLPDSRGMLASVFSTNSAEPGVFYAANNHGIFRSPDAGLNWEELPIPWPGGQRPGRANSLVALPE